VDVPLMYTTSGLIDKPLAIDYIKANYPGVDLTLFKTTLNEIETQRNDHKQLSADDLLKHVQICDSMNESLSDAKGGEDYDRILHLLTAYLHLPESDTTAEIAHKILALPPLPPYEEE